MAQDTWFLERNGKFYGPFNTQKILTLLEGGKVAKTNLVASDREGTDAKPLRELEAFGGSPTVAVQPVQEPATKSREPAAEWFVLDGEERQGPYVLEQLKTMRASQELTNETDVIKKGAEKPIKLGLLAPDTAQQPKSAVSERTTSEPKRRSLNRTKPLEAAKPKSKGSGRVIVPVILVIGVLATAVYFLIRPDAQERLDNLFRGSQEPGSTTRLQRSPVPRKEPPPFNQLVQIALSQGLNFSYEELKNNHRDALLNYESRGPRELGEHYGERIKREVRFTIDGDFSLTYALDVYDFAFAVVIKSPQFESYQIDDLDLGQFSTGARVQERVNDIFWVTAITEEVVAKAVWRKTKSGSYLDSVVVENQSP